MPDIDIDFCIRRRQEVIEYVQDKYGADHVAQIVTFGTMAARGAIRDVGRALNMPYADVDVVAKQVPSGPGHSISPWTRPSSCPSSSGTPYEGDAADQEPHRHGQRPSRACPATPPPTPPGVVITRKPVVRLCAPGEERRVRWSPSTS